MIWGTLSDRYGRRPQFIGCMLFLALTCVGLALTPTSAFWLLMLPSFSILFSLPDETESWVYLFRVFAYLLIMLAIVLKNRRRLGHLAHSPRAARRDKRPWGA